MAVAKRRAPFAELSNNPFAELLDSESSPCKLHTGKQRRSRRSFLERLAPDAALLVCSFLNPESLCAGSRVCHNWRQIMSHDMVWARILERADAVALACGIDSDGGDGGDGGSVKRQFRRLWLENSWTLRCESQAMSRGRACWLRADKHAPRRTLRVRGTGAHGYTRAVGSVGFGCGRHAWSVRVVSAPSEDIFIGVTSAMDVEVEGLRRDKGAVDWMLTMDSSGVCVTHHYQPPRVARRRASRSRIAISPSFNPDVGRGVLPAGAGVDGYSDDDGEGGDSSGLESESDGDSDEWHHCGWTGLRVGEQLQLCLDQQVSPPVLAFFYASDEDIMDGADATANAPVAPRGYRIDCPLAAPGGGAELSTLRPSLMVASGVIEVVPLKRIPAWVDVCNANAVVGEVDEVYDSDTDAED